MVCCEPPIAFRRSGCRALPLRSPPSPSPISWYSALASHFCCAWSDGHQLWARAGRLRTSQSGRPESPQVQPARCPILIRRQRSNAMLTLPWLDLPLVWAGLIAFAVLAYVVMDGFDLGTGI